MNSNEMWSQFIDVADVVATVVDPTTGTLLLQLGDVARGRADSSRAEAWQQPGVCSRPANPAAGSAACQAIVLKSGDRDVCPAMRDTRANRIYGNLGPGDTCVYGTAGQARGLFRSDGSARLMTTADNTADGATIFNGVSPFYRGTDGGKHLGGEWRYYAPFGGQWHDPQGYHLRHTSGGNPASVVKVDATTVGFTVLGVSYQKSFYALQADVVAVNSSSIQLGSNQPGGTPQQRVVLATSLQTQLASVATSLTAAEVALAAAATSLSAAADPKVVAAGGSLTTAATQLLAAISALEAITPLTVGSTTVTAK